MVFNTVCTNLRAELNDTTAATLARLVRWLNNIHMQVCGLRNWPFLIVEESDSMSIAAASVPYALATITFDTGIAHETNWAVDEILDVWDVTDSVLKLEKTTYDRLRQQYQTTLTETGTPTFWYYSKQVRADSAGPQKYVSFYPALAATRTMRFRFSRKPTEQASGSVAKLLIPDEWSHVVYEGVLARAWRQRGDDRWIDCKENFDKAIADMKAKLSSEIITGFNPAGVSSRTRFPTTVTA